MKRLKLFTILMLLTLVVGGTAKAVFPQSFWRMVQISERLSFLYGGVDNPAEKVSFESDGRVGIGVIPQNSSAILELKSENKALLVTRVNSVFDLRVVENGMIVYERARECFRVYQDAAWSDCLGFGNGIRVLTGDPAPQRPGDVYYNKIDNILYIYDGNTWVPVTANFLQLVSYNYNCTRHDLAHPRLELTCPNHKHIRSLFYETATYSNTTDVHTIPEVNAVECCQIAHGAHWWDTSVWSTCANGTQNRSVSCKDVNGGIVGEGLCVGEHRPATSQSCDAPDGGSGGGVGTWETGAWSPSPCPSSGQQTRTVQCVNGFGHAATDCNQGQRPSSTQSCTPTTTDTYRWEAGAPFGACINGEQTQRIRCKSISSGNEVSNFLCNGLPSPSNTRSCSVTSGCEGKSVHIGVGHPLYRFVSDTGTWVNFRGFNQGVDRISFGNSGPRGGGWDLRDFVAFTLGGELNVDHTRAIGSMGVEAGIGSHNVRESATAQEICRMAGFGSVLGGVVVQNAYDSPGSNRHWYFRNGQFNITNAKHPIAGIQKDTKLSRLVCGDPLPVSCQ